ncbi:MAG: guanylate kinase [Gemmatimonadetes bacterium]|nr:guanylate kinase [Gemmatimonadota bacterium]
MNESPVPPYDRTFPVILAGPSGAGKTTVRDALLGGPDADRYRFSVSMTTRDPRPGERPDVDYAFVDRDRFLALVEAGGMLEHAEVHGELYGTPSANLDAARERGAHLLLDIDVQGARQVRAVAPEVVTIFLVPPEAARIVDRLERRGSETPEQLARRLSSARAELEAAPEFDYLIVNDVLDEAIARVRAVVDAEEGRVARSREATSTFASRMIADLDDGRPRW